MNGDGFWLATERVESLRGTERVWLRALGESSSLSAIPFLMHTGMLASHYPCVADDPCGCHHEMVEREDGRFNAWCTCSEPNCERFTLSKYDLLIYELDTRMLFDGVGKALSLYGDASPVDGLSRTTMIGYYQPIAGHRYPVYLSIKCDAGEVRRCVTQLVAENDAPFILILPTHRFDTVRLRDILKRRNAGLIVLSDILTLTPDAELTVNENAVTEFESFHKVAGGRCTDSAIQHPTFPTPGSASWGDLTITFLDGHTVRVDVRGARRTLSYSQMGMVNTRNNTPTKAWDFLREVSENRRVIDEHIGVYTSNKAWRHTLSKALRQFFQIEGDPFLYDSEDKTWTAVFVLNPEVE